MEENIKIEETNNDRCYTVYMHTSPNGKRYVGLTKQTVGCKRSLEQVQILTGNFIWRYASDIPDPYAPLFPHSIRNSITT